MNLDIGGRIALVTGADSGIGMETARRLLQEGVRVAISDQDADSLKKSVDALKSDGDVIGSVDQAIDKFLKEERPGMALKRRGEPQEVAAMIVFPCSERASFVNGSNLRVDSGSVATV